MAMLQWGPYAFEANGMGYEELTHQAGGRWKDHEIIGRRPAGQYLGPDKETVKIKGVVFPLDNGAGSVRGVKALQEASRAGQTHPLATGRGELLGQYRLEKISRAEALLIDNGAALKVSYDLEFVYQEDGAGAIWSLWP